MEDLDNLSFEQAFQGLTETVQALEGGDLPLEQALALFERGIRLATLCDQQLNQAELRVRQVTGDSVGGFEATPFDGWSDETEDDR